MFAVRNASRRLLSAGTRRHASTHTTTGETYTGYEGYATPFWRNVVLASLAGVAFYKFAPAPGEDVYLTRWIAMYLQPRETLLDMNAKHTALSQEVSDQTLLFHDAKQPIIRRLRYPQVMDQFSPFNTPPGMVDMKDVVAKRE